MILHDLVVQILDAVLALIQGVFVLLGSLKYVGKGHPLKFSISSMDRINIVANPRQKEKII